MKIKIVKNKLLKLAKKYQRPQSIMHFINAATLKEAYEKQPDSDIKRKYGKDLDANIEELLRRMKEFSYFPQSKDWLQGTNKCRASKKEKCMRRSFEDRMVQYLFREILEAIFEIQICRIMPDLKKKVSAKVSCQKYNFKELLNWIKIDVVWFLKEIDKEHLIDFLKQKVDDKNFIRYFERLLQSGVKLLEECTDFKSESAVSFISMIYSVCKCYILQLLDSAMKEWFNGNVWVVSNDKNVKIMFEKSTDCVMAYLQLGCELRKIGIKPVKDKIRFVTLYNPKIWRKSISQKTPEDVIHHLSSRKKIQYNNRKGKK